MWSFPRRNADRHTHPPYSRPLPRRLQRRQSRRQPQHLGAREIREQRIDLARSVTGDRNLRRTQHVAASLWHSA